jgi:hypothetical protein
VNNAETLSLLLEVRIMTTALINGLEIIAIMTAMTLVVCPMLLWVLPNRRVVP